VIQRLFHVACAMILAASVVATVVRDRPNQTSVDAKAQLIRFLEQSGFTVTGERRLIGDETTILTRIPDCEAPVEVIFMPSIHRISPIATSLIGKESGAVLIHAQEVVSSLSADVLIPRWLKRRMLVNLHLAAETPWTSIAIAILPAPDCKLPRLLLSDLATM
jgi:hypothetical protein